MRLGKPFIGLALVCLFAGGATAGDISAPHVHVAFEGITEPQARSIANTVSAAWTIFSGEFGFEMPDRIKVAVSIGKQAKLSSAGESVFLELRSPEELDPPERTRLYNLYGMCHELGHIAWAKNMRGLYVFDWDGNEGWAHYMGSEVVDRLYDLKGPSLWHVPYDYRADGSARLKRSLAEKHPSGIDRAAGSWQELESLIGRRGFAKLLPALWEATHTLSGGLSPAIQRALVTAFPNKAEPLTAWWSRSADLLLGRYNR
jgi:hypothetical protein